MDHRQGVIECRVVNRQRAAIRQVLDGQDHRLLVVIDPGVAQDMNAALDHAEELASLAAGYRNQLLIALYTRLGAVHVGLPLVARLADAPIPLDALAYGLSSPCGRTASRPRLPIGCESRCPHDLAETIGAIGYAAARWRPELGDRVVNHDAHLVVRWNGFDRCATTDALARLDIAGLPRRLVVDSRAGEPRHLAAAVAGQVSEGEPGIVGVVVGTRGPGDALSTLDELATAVGSRLCTSIGVAP
ncbi:hypothetical protein ACIA8G_04165 [Lentzea sp. NPDC051213]|uniref:hypothetical protein n=1 Tax=Lentzea sp. NPDC051213 TaxID=3364126 RepID=UPI0037B8A6AD